MTKFNKRLFIAAFINLFSLVGLAQESSPTPADEPIRISTEEIQLNVTAQYSGGRFVSTLTKDDLLAVEAATRRRLRV